MNKKLIIICILMALALVFAAGCGCVGNAESVAELLSLGEQFLLENKYEQALVQFMRVIEIEPMNPRGYTGAAQAHIGLGDVDAAIAILKQGLEVLLDEVTIIRMLVEELGLEEVLAILDEDVRMLIEELGLEEVLLGELQGTDRMEHELTIEQVELMRQLFAVLKSDNFSVAGAIVDSDVYRQLVEKAYVDGIIFYQSSYGSLAIYPNGNVYAGGLVDGFREGFGIWFQGTSDALQYRYFRGQWENDLPNGQGSIHSIRDEGRIERMEGRSYGLYSIDKGMFSNGYFHGQFSQIWYMCNGDVLNWIVPFELGIAQVAYVRSECDSAELELYRGTHRVFGL